LTCLVEVSQTGHDHASAAGEPPRRPGGDSECGQLNMALYSGLYVRHDAISNSLGHKLNLLGSLRRCGLPVSWTAFVSASDYDDPRVRVVTLPGYAMADPTFWSAQLHVFEFGIAYDLFNCILALPPGAVAVVIYHNITPLDLVDDEVVRAAIVRSLIQKHNLFAARHVICVSELNRDELVDFGIPPERLSVAHLPVTHQRAPRPAIRPAEDRGQPVRLLYVGRLVRAKGLIDLIRAVEEIYDKGLTCFALDLVGSPTWSDPATLAELARTVARKGLGDRLLLHSGLDDRELAALYHQADVLVVPSYHEGYCVPVVEAYTAGCYVITSDAGNLPRVVGGLGTVVPTGNVGALVAALSDVVGRFADAKRRSTTPLLPTARGELTLPDWHEAIDEHLADYSARAYQLAVLRGLVAAADQLPEGVPSWLVREVADRAELGHPVRR